MEKSGKHHFVIEALGHRALRGLGHVLDLRHRLADVVGIAEAFVEGENLGDCLFVGAHQKSRDEVG
ncbi:hypothetical protein D3C76_1500250 [compost metagenome]